jgi:hypothetical protein
VSFEGGIVFDARVERLAFEHMPCGMAVALVFRLRDRTVEAQQRRASGLALVTAAIALWNTVYLGRALDAVRRVAKPFRPLCLPTSRRSAGSISISPATISGTPTACHRRMGSDSCAPRRAARSRRRPVLWRDPC